MEIEVDELAEFLFIKNEDNIVVELSLGGITDNKDLFYFCHDLFCKGLVILYGKENALIINDITDEQFFHVKKKMSNAGINVQLDIINREAPPDLVDTSSDVPCDLPREVLYPNVNMHELEALPNHLRLEDYKFEINFTPELSYGISFSLFHKTV